MSVRNCHGVVLTGQTPARNVEGRHSLAPINIMLAVKSEFEVQFSDEQLTAFHDDRESRRFLTDGTSR